MCVVVAPFVGSIFWLSCLEGNCSSSDGNIVELVWHSLLLLWFHRGTVKVAAL